MPKKTKKEISSEITETFGYLKVSEKNKWSTFIGKISWNGEAPTLNIRRLNTDSGIWGHGVTLTNEDADTLTNILLKNGFGNLETLEDAVNHRKSFFTITDEEDEYEIELNLED